MWPNDLQKWQNDGEIITNPARFGMIGGQSPRPANRPNPNPTQPASPNQPGPINPQNQPSTINRGSINPAPTDQTGGKRGQSTNPGQTPNRSNDPPNQPRPIKQTGVNNRGKPTRPNRVNK